MSRRRQVALSATGALVGLAIALAIPGRGRIWALFVCLLLLGGAALVVLVWRTGRAIPAVGEIFWQPSPATPQRIPQLEEIRQELETALALGSDARGELGARLRIVATARLAERRGIELDRQPERARAAIDDELTWRLIQRREHFERAELPPLREAELSRVLGSLERI